MAEVEWPEHHLQLSTPNPMLQDFVNRQHMQHSSGLATSPAYRASIPLVVRDPDVHDEHGEGSSIPSSTDKILNKTEVIAKIEEIFASIGKNLAQERVLSIPIKTRAQITAGVRQVSFPGATAEEAWRFTVILRILEMVHAALVDGVNTTKRDIYYKDPALFMKQGVVDKWIDDLAFTFGVQRSMLNVVATAIGLVAGSFTIKRSDGSTIDMSSGLEGLSVPSIDNTDRLDISSVQWILVIEKEATFHSLALKAFYRNHKIGNGIIVTGKGYPDISTRKLLHRLSVSHLPSVAPPDIFAVVDLDPDGIGIMSTYKYGSISLAHEGSELTLPTLRWLGLTSSDLPKEESATGGSRLLSLTARDRKKAIHMLNRDPIANGKEPEWQNELQVMLMLNIKAEIQIMSNSEEDLESWLEGKIKRMST
ncbi:hypothetical protein MMC13_002233 [Lambiella insularis]|nr:hypothetical protein [Lambiella insularis]